MWCKKNIKFSNISSYIFIDYFYSTEIVYCNKSLDRVSLLYK